jgi:hypothetical protein
MVFAHCVFAMGPEVKVCRLIFLSLSLHLGTTNHLKVTTRNLIPSLGCSRQQVRNMSTAQDLTYMALNLTIDDRTRLEDVLNRKLQNIPEHVIPDLTIDDILHQSPRALHIPTVPPDLQLPYILHHRALIDRHGGHPIKDERAQSFNTTRAIFFYHLDESHQFKRYHDLSRWNLALFTALLCSPPTPDTSPVQVSHKFPAHKTEAEHITPAARRFMTSYIAAVLEHQNTPTAYDKREGFIRRWKGSRWDLFERFGASQRKLLKKEMQCLNAEWEHELDSTAKDIGRKAYDAQVARFVGCVVPGRKDQALREKSRGVLQRDHKEMDVELELGNELSDALCVPLEEARYQDHDGYDEDVATPVDVRYAITCMQNVRPKDILPMLMRLFPMESGE